MNELHYWECPECHRINPYLQRKCDCSYAADGSEAQYKTCTACGCLLPASRVFCDCGKFLPTQKNAITEADIEAAYQSGRFAGIAEERERTAKEQSESEEKASSVLYEKTEEEKLADEYGMTVEQYRTYLRLKRERDEQRAQEVDKHQRSTTHSDYAIAKALCAAAIVIFLAWTYIFSPSYRSYNNVPDTAQTLTPAPFTNGRVICYPPGECIAPLTVQTKSGADTHGDNYYIVLNPVDFTAKQNGAVAFLVEGGKTVERNVPLGEYELYYACGETWYGPESKFGPESGLYKCDETFEFTEDEEGTYGWTVTLYTTQNGNLNTETVSWSEFPDIGKTTGSLV